MDASITSALIGAVAVGGTALGTVLGGWVQARGGQAQARAAQQAARIAAEASHMQALHDRRWAVLAAYLRSASECLEAADRLYSADSLPEARRHWYAFALAHAEAELAAPTALLPQIDDLRKAVGRMYWTSQLSAPGHRALKELRRRVAEGEGDAVRAKEAVDRLWATHEGAPLPVRESSPEYAQASQALDALPGFGREPASLLLSSTREQRDAARREREEHKENHHQARRKLVAAARNAFGTDRL